MCVCVSWEWGYFTADEEEKLSMYLLSRLYGLKFSDTLKILLGPNYSHLIFTRIFGGAGVSIGLVGSEADEQMDIILLFIVNKTK